MAPASSKKFLETQANCRVWIRSETRTWHHNNIQSIIFTSPGKISIIIKSGLFNKQCVFIRAYTCLIILFIPMFHLGKIDGNMILMTPSLAQIFQMFLIQFYNFTMLVLSESLVSSESLLVISSNRMISTTCASFGSIGRINWSDLSKPNKSFGFCKGQLENINSCF